MHKTLLCTALLGAAAALPAQLSGTYTIDAAGTGGRNFTSFTDAFLALWQKGMTQPVTLVAAPGTYKESLWLAPVVGMSKSNRLTIMSQVKHQAVLAPGANEILQLLFSSDSNPIEGLVLDGLQFANAANGVRAHSPVRNLEIRNCLFARSLTTTGIAIASGRFLDVHHNLFDAPKRAFTLSNSEGDIAFHHNEVRLDDSYGLYVANRVDSTTLPGPTRIYNNLILGKLANAVGSVAPIYIANLAVNTEVMHNSIRVDCPVASVPLIRASGIWLLPNVVRNNILMQTGSGPVLTVATTSALDLDLDSNVYFSAKATPLATVEGSTTTYSTLAAWQQATSFDKNSLQADPQFASATDLRVQSTSPAIGRAIGTPDHVNDDFAGTLRGASAAIDIGAYQTASPFEYLGSGCPGLSNRVPVLTASGLAKLGSNQFAIHLANARPSSTTFIAIGASDTSWGSIPLPFPLGGTCSLLVAPHILFRTGSAASGEQTLSLGIPNDNRLKGSRTYFQWAVVDPAAAGMGLAMSNAGVLKL